MLKFKVSLFSDAPITHSLYSFQVVPLHPQSSLSVLVISLIRGPWRRLQSSTLQQQTRTDLLSILVAKVPILFYKNSLSLTISVLKVQTKLMVQSSHLKSLSIWSTQFLTWIHFILPFLKKPHLLMKLAALLAFKFSTYHALRFPNVISKSYLLK